MERMLLLDPQSRVTAAEALTFLYFAEYREPDEETEAQPYDHSLDNTDLTLEQWKRKGECGERRQWGKSRQMHLTDQYPAVLLPAGHTFTEILTFKPVLPESKETSL